MLSRNFYKEAKNKIASILKSNGFSSSGNSFYYFKNDSCGVIMIQKGVVDKLGGLKFTLNFGVCSNIIRKFYEGGSGKPEYDECQWKVRIGFFMEEKSDFWWNVLHESEMFNVLTDVELKLKKVLPIFLEKISEDFLKEEWLGGVATGITEFERLQYLTIFLKKENSPILGKIVNELLAYSKGKSIEYPAKIHLSELNCI